ncbi:uncharacterized protein L3040_007390 [Drepanopeziza brunnea f. sp. 'multigermtubi']|uniref:uncharacterized protein n=1 Tax=Drepanopeziza brunnea f. sp. 'multigermtubi' TaxID=698441 RepID=UPI00238B6F28|nr:hypothetical protein L3040_007390 [Drepanopeziza brunnea f. sp. 'multigermtubi']
MVSVKCLLTVLFISAPSAKHSIKQSQASVPGSALSLLKMPPIPSRKHAFVATIVTSQNAFQLERLPIDGQTAFLRWKDGWMQRTSNVR